MRKLAIVLLIVLSIFAFASCKQEPEHEHTFSEEWTSDETNHWHVATCEHTDEVADKSEHTWDAGTDDGNGKMVKEIVYYDNGNVRKLTEYNEKELPVRIICYDYGDNPVTWTQTCEYDGNGNEIKRVTYADDILITWYEMEYDEIGAKYGRYTRVVSKNEDGKILDYTEMKYVESGDNVPVRVMQMNYDGDSTIVAYGYEIELDEYGNEVRYKRYEKGELVSQTVFEYKAFVEPIGKK